MDICGVGDLMAGVRCRDDKRESKMKKVYTAQGPAEAHLVKGFLEAQGIPTIVQGENLYAIRGGVPMTSDTLPSVWILQDADFDRAKDLVTEFCQQADNP